MHKNNKKIKKHVNKKYNKQHKTKQNITKIKNDTHKKKENKQQQKIIIKNKTIK